MLCSSIDTRIVCLDKIGVNQDSIEEFVDTCSGYAFGLAPPYGDFFLCSFIAVLMNCPNFLSFLRFST